MVNGISNYNDWVTSLNSRGIKTTSLGNGEANFADYTNALSDSLKQEIMASFDTAADYDLQSKLASVLGGKNLIQSTNLKQALSGTGINYSVKYVNTSYIVDNKAGGYTKNATNGSIAVYTFTDANGGEIKIADANGNGALESEEIFMNEILSGVVSDISAGGGMQGAQNTQDNMLAKMEALLAQMEEQMGEQQKQFEETMQKLQEIEENNDTKNVDKKSGKETKTKDTNPKDDEKEIEEIKKQAKKSLQQSGLGLSNYEIDSLLENITEKVSNGESLDKVINKIIGKIESEQTADAA